MRRAFSSSYLAGEPAARAFIPAEFRDGATRVAAARAAAKRAAAPGLIAALREQDARLPDSAARRRHVELLAGGGCAVVATGQQVGLFLGPLYSFYKAASAVAVARAIAAESGVPCVPLFWLQTEDHDFAEIAGCTVAGTDGAPVTLSLRTDGGDRSDDGRVSIAHRALGDEVAALLDALGEALPAGDAATEVLALLRAHYRPGRSLAGAFAGVMATLFADEGLVVLDPRHPAVSAHAAPIYERVLSRHAAVERALNAQCARLRDAGFDEQIVPRPDCSLLFFHPRGAAGPRFRLQRAPDGGDLWTLAGDATTI
ncbi:MAG TPA: bacillithiol biosynthesis BshC, partial [Polyangia bacterium]|nr:bacillithiol biosynthesis BshC [Polyangia bacterium]